MNEGREIGRPIYEHCPDRIEIGPENVQWIPIKAVNILPQTRTEYTEEAMVQLEDSLMETDEDGRVKIKLLHPPTLNVFRSRTASRQYVEDLNACWELDNPVTTSIKPNKTENGDVYTVLIAGHRRMHAILRILEKNEIDLDRVDVAFSVEDDLDFYQALDLQYRENEHQRLSPWQDARAISSRYRAGVERGEFESFADCSRAMGVTPERVSDAWKFYQLPKFLQEEVRNQKDTRFTYGKAVHIYHLAHAYAVTIMSKWVRRELNLDDDQMRDFNTKLLSKSLEVILGDLDEADRDHIDYQLRDHRRSIAKRSMEDVKTYVKVNVLDITESAGVTEFMTLEDQRLIDRSKEQKKLALTRNGTFTLLSILLNQLVDDASIVHRMNRDSSIDERVLRLVHSPSGRRVLGRVTGLLEELDGAIPDQELVEAIGKERKSLIEALSELRDSNRLHDVVSSTANMYGSTNGITELSMF
jgi:hypothetical protein